MHRLFMGALLVVIAICLLPAQIHAQELAHCHKVDKQAKFLTKKQKTVVRIQALNVIVKDLKTLKKTMLNNVNMYPKSMLSNCYNKKVSAVEGMIKIADQRLLGDTNFQMIYGEYLMIRSRYKEAYEYFNDVAVRNPFTYVPHWKTLEAWTYWRKFARDNMEKKEINIVTLNLLKNLIHTKDIPDLIRAKAEVLQNTLTGVVEKT